MLEEFVAFILLKIKEKKNTIEYMIDDDYSN